MTVQIAPGVSERAAAGKAARQEVPRSTHAEWHPAPRRRNVVDLLEDECADRIPELIPIRNARMSTSAFAFFRGSAGLMAADLAETPVSGIQAQLCGDAHLMNFGAFGSPERNLVFDLNDFDETLPGPWEWDVKRLAASIVIAGRERGFAAKVTRTAARDAVGMYREAMRGFARMSPIDIWYSHLRDHELDLLREQISSEDARRFQKNVAKARGKDSTRAFARLAYRMNGGARITPDPPLITPIEDLVPAEEAAEIEARMNDMLAQYRATLPADRQRLLDRYRYAHMARKVAGVGSVGTRGWVILLLGVDHGDPLFLQAKEGERSALEPYAGASEFDNQGQRVVEGQRLMQASGDILLGWIRTTGIDGRTRDFYLRQLWDWKGSADVERMSEKALHMYGLLCAWTLARAHARSGDPIAIGSYLGSGDRFDRAVAKFAESYADQNERDYRTFMDALASGRITAETG